jgi:hypothetical protein
VSKTNVAAAAKTLAMLKGFFMFFTVRRRRARGLYLTVAPQCVFFVNKNMSQSVQQHLILAISNVAEAVAVIKWVRSVHAILHPV